MIAIEDVKLSYGSEGPAVLDGVSFAIPEGSITLISGPTGCGKSTIVKLICGIIPHLQSASVYGQVTVDGDHPEKLSVRELCRKVGVVLQSVDHQIFTSSVRSEVAFGLENFGVPAEGMEAEISKALELVDASHLSERQINTLSGGEKQRVVLASVLVLNPSVLVLDEPLAFLDQSMAVRLLDLLRDLSNSGVTIIIIEHRRELVGEIADQEISLRDGKCCESQEAWQEFQQLRPHEPGEEILHWENLVFSWGDKPLADSVNLSVSQGESVVICGDNGTGKSTLLRLTLGLLKPISGTIRVAGKSIAGMKTQQIANDVALVLQNPSHQLHLPTVEEEILCRCHDRELAHEILKRCGLDSRAQDHPHVLSQGQKRRLTIAAALASKPKLLILDEPTVGQDDESLRIILEVIDHYISDGGAVLSTSHDPRAIRSLGHRIYDLCNGQLTEKKTENPEIQIQKQEKSISS